MVAVALVNGVALEVSAAEAELHATPLVIAHRGASGYLPEHTLAAYELALAQGADFVEPDVVATADGVLIARHENALAEVALDEAGALRLDAHGRPVVVQATTDVADRAEFADRLTVKRIDGRPVGGWFSEDFTLAEVRTLRARERLPALRPGSAEFDGRHGVPTLAEVIALVARVGRAQGSSPGLYIETKHPTHFAVEGRRLDGTPIAFDLGEGVLEALRAAEFTDPRRVFIQSFEIANLIALADRMRALELEIPLVQLYGDVFNRRYRAQPYDVVYHARSGADLGAIYGALAQLVRGGLGAATSYAELGTPEVLAFLRERYATAIGPPKDAVLLVRATPEGDTGGRVLTGETGPLVAAARAAGLAVHPYTLRAEAPFLVRDGDRVVPVEEEAVRLLESGVQGFFIDQPDAGRRAVQTYLSKAARVGDSARSGGG